MDKKLKKWEETAEDLREHVATLCDQLEEKKSELQSAAYQTLRHRLTELHAQLDRIDALLAAKAVSTDKPDKPLYDVKF